MKMIRNVLGVFALMFAAGSTASSVFVDPSTVSVAPGDLFSVTVRADFVDVGGFTSGGFLLGWDSSVVSLVDNGTPNPVITDVLGIGTTTTANSLEYGFATCFSCSPANVLGAADPAFEIYTINFQVAPAAAIGGSNLILSIGVISDAWTGPSGQDTVTPPPGNFLGATVNVQAVPVPPAVWLFGSGLVGLVAVSRRRRMTQPV